MTQLRENALIGLLVALSIGPDLAPEPGIALAVRLGAFVLLALLFGRRLGLALLAGAWRPKAGTR